MTTAAAAATTTTPTTPTGATLRETSPTVDHEEARLNADSDDGSHGSQDPGKMFIGGLSWQTTAGLFFSCFKQGKVALKSLEKFFDFGKFKTTPPVFRPLTPKSY
uniref:Uncharacterized protein n=1 Tax=Caenorhabditis japonica TaxID=281687 RepID=A0A8R1I1H1_CAEJA